MGKATIRCAECGKTAQCVLPATHKTGHGIDMYCSKCHADRRFRVV